MLSTRLKRAPRAKVFGLFATLGIVVALTAPAAALATPCNSWKSPTSGSWSDPTMWSANAVPTSSDDACITQPGTYTVTNTGATTVKTLTLGGASGTATLELDSNCSVNTDFTTTNGTTIGAHGAITLSNTGCGTRTSLNGPVTNNGTVTTTAGGERDLRGSLVNNATLNIGVNSRFDTVGATLTNSGTVAVADTVQLGVFGSATTFTNGSSGAIHATGSGVVYMNGQTVFNEAGTTSGSGPVEVDSATLNYTGTGASLIFERGTSSVSGNIASGQTLNVQNDCGENADVTAVASWTNAGAINLQSAGCGDRSSLDTTSGTLTNTGTIHAIAGGTQFLRGNVTNSTGGHISIDAGQVLSEDTAGATVTNNGIVTLSGDGTQYAVSGSATTFTNGSSGAIHATGSGVVYMNGQTVFNEAGTTSGSGPVEVDSATLNYTGTGASLIFERGTSSVSGNIASGQTLNVQNDCGENADVTAVASWTNAGAINLQSAGCGDRSSLDTTSGTLTNTGTIASLTVGGGSRFLRGNVTNSGTLTVNQSLADDTGGTITVSGGTVNVANSQSFTLSGTSTTVNDNGGTIAGNSSGTLVESGGTWNQGAGKSSGTQPILIDNTALQYLGTGATNITAHGTGNTIAGNIAGTGQKLQIENTCSENSTVTAAASFTNSGAIQLQSAGCGNNSILSMAGLTLTNKGTLTTFAGGAGGLNRVDGNVSSTKIVGTAAARNLNITGTYTTSATGTFKPGVSSSGTGVLTVNGAVTIGGGTLAVTRTASYKPTAGTTLTVLSAASVSGTFAKETGGGIVSGRYFFPQYTPTAVNITVLQATLTEAPTSGSAGTVVTLSGTGWPANDTLTIKFRDHSGTTTTFPTTTTNGSGAFSVNETVPSGAVLGKGTFTVTSSLSGLAFPATFTVT